MRVGPVGHANTKGHAAERPWGERGVAEVRTGGVKRWN